MGDHVHMTRADFVAAIGKWRERLAKPPPKDVALCDQARALADEIPYLMARLEDQATADRLHWGFVTTRHRELQAAVETLRKLAERDPAGTAP